MDAGFDFNYSWGQDLARKTPLLSIEITRECPLHCPGCYAYGESHLGGATRLRDIADFRGDDLVNGILGLVAHHDPIHVSLVGGEPLIRHRELQRACFQFWSSRSVHDGGDQRGDSDPEGMVNAAAPFDGGSIHRRAGKAEHDDGGHSPRHTNEFSKNIEGRKRLTCTARSCASICSATATWMNSWHFGARGPEIHRIWFSIYTPQRRRLAGAIAKRGSFALRGAGRRHWRGVIRS